MNYVGDHGPFSLTFARLSRVSADGTLLLCNLYTAMFDKVVACCACNLDFGIVGRDRDSLMPHDILQDEASEMRTRAEI